MSLMSPSSPETFLLDNREAHRRVRLRGVPVDLLSLAETVSLAADAMETRTPRRHVALNVAKFMKMRRDPELARDVCESDIVGIDGMGIVWALRLFGVPNAARVAGIDLMLALLHHCAVQGKKPFVLGARMDVLNQAADIARTRYPGLQFAGLRDGYFDSADEGRVVDEIRRSGADCLFVAMPTPRKERFLHRHGGQLGVPFIMGVGGSVDVLAGKVSRAPAWMQKAGLEWAHRLLQEPRKMFWRYATTNTAFLWFVLQGLVSRLIGRSPVARAPHSEVSARRERADPAID